MTQAQPQDLENGPPDPSSLTDKQNERRQRVIRAAFDLASEGGYEAVQMRDVAARADVALGTVYRYFSSKDQLLAAVWVDWTAALERRLGRQPLEGSTRAERLIDFLRRATRPLERKPKLAAALVMSATSTDPGASPYQREVSSWMTRITHEVLEGLSPSEEQGIREVMGHLWHSVLIGWVSGRVTTERMHELLANACHLMLDPRESTGDAARAKLRGPAR
jgi:TetR/AcrR family transcriptional regulator, cholesterol catabolism regulator